jgi:hypothetical protein
MIYKQDEIIKLLLSKQLKDIAKAKKLEYADLKRICEYIKGNIFDEKECCLWHGYITNLEKETKGIYINFYFHGKKVALHRLLYINFIGILRDDEYIKFGCINRGKCCTISHLVKCKYNKIEKIREEKIEIPIIDRNKFKILFN